MPRNQLFTVVVQLADPQSDECYEVQAPDAACALGTALDELEQELGHEPKLARATVMAGAMAPGRRRATWDTMPKQIQAAFERGVAAERSPT